MPCRYNYTGRGDGEDGDFMWCTCTVIATEKVPKGNVAGNVGCLVSDRVILSGPNVIVELS